MAQQMLTYKRRTSYPLEVKLRAVEEAEQKGLKEAAKAMRVHEGVLRQWVGKGNALRLAGEKAGFRDKRRLPRSPQVDYLTSRHSLHNLTAVIRSYSSRLTELIFQNSRNSS